MAHLATQHQVFRVRWKHKALVALAAVLVGVAGHGPAIAAPALIWPFDCTKYYDVGDLTEAYDLQGVGVLCLNTLLAGPNGVEGPAADDMHLTIVSDTGGSFRIGNGGHQVSIGGIPQTLGTGNLPGESFRFGPGTIEVDISSHDGMDLQLPVDNQNPNVKRLCVRMSDAGVVLPGPDPCRPAPGQPPWIPPGEDVPPPDGPVFPIGDRVFPNRAWDTGGLILDFNGVAETPTLGLTLLALAVSIGVRSRRRRSSVTTSPDDACVRAARARQGRWVSGHSDLVTDRCMGVSVGQKNGWASFGSGSLPST